MAKVHPHDSHPKLRGKFGDKIYKWYGDTCVVQKVPVRRKRRQSARLKAAYANLRQAVRYAQGVIADPAAKKYYEYAARRLRRSVYIVAKADAMQPPKVELWLPYNYQGHAGEGVTIRTGDLFRVQTARITVRDAAGDIVETGEATRQPKKIFFAYRWKRDHPSGQVLTVELIAESRAGHQVVITEKMSRPRPASVASK
jgi:hypothetical protein